VQEAINLIKNLKGYDYVEGILFDKNRIVLMTGICTDNADYPVQTFSEPKDPWFYKHVEEISFKQKTYSECIPIVDYLFRYDRGAYWMGKYFMQYVGGYNSLSRKIFDSSLHTKEMYEALHLGNLSQSFFVQDFYVPVENLDEFIQYVCERLDIYPLWLCPMKSTQKPEKLSPHYSKSKLLVNVGVYGRSSKFARDYLQANRDVEHNATELNARKMLYAHAYYPVEEFWKIYDKKWYDSLRKKYHADRVFSDVFERTHVSEVYKPRAIRGAIKFYLKKWFDRK
jgi:hypothetical protein